MSKSLYSILSLRGSKQESASTVDIKLTDQHERSSIRKEPSTFNVNRIDGDHMQVFWLRTLTCILVPIFVTCYYAGLWAYWIKGYDDSGPVSSGPSAGRWAYYIWYALPTSTRDGRSTTKPLTVASY
jgi:hypothetical protein